MLNRERTELEALPLKIEELESEQKSLNTRLWEPDLYQKEPDQIPLLKARLGELEKEISQAYARWEELEALRLATSETENQQA